MRLLTFFLLFLCNNAFAEIYKKQNPDGSITYSDTKSTDSTVITPPTLISTPGFKPKRLSENEEEDKNKPLPYRLLAISAPTNQSVINSNAGSLSIQLAIKPALQTHFKHSITVFLDGKPVKTGLTSLTTEISNINRGSHMLSAQIIGPYKKALKSSKSITIHMKQHSILHKKPALPY